MQQLMVSVYPNSEIQEVTSCDDCACRNEGKKHSRKRDVRQFWKERCSFQITIRFNIINILGNKSVKASLYVASCVIQKRYSPNMSDQIYNTQNE